MSCPNCGCSNYQSKPQAALFRGQPIDQMDEATKDKAVEFLIENTRFDLDPNNFGWRPNNIYEYFLLYNELDEPRRHKVRDVYCDLLKKYYDNR